MSMACLGSGCRAGIRRFTRATCGLPVLLALTGALPLVLTGCGDPSEKFMARVDEAPAGQRPPDWDRTRALMARRAPAVGELAPDFTLPTPDGSRMVMRSELQGRRPMVLVFGSFT